MPMDAAWRRFYGANALLLAATAASLLWLFHATDLDLQLATPYYDPINRWFPWRSAWITRTLIHRDLMNLLIAAGVGVWLVALYARLVRVPAWLAGRTRRWWVLAISYVLVPTVISTWRHFSAMHCPWDVSAFGGYAPYFDLLSPAPAGLHAGRCFPSGFTASGAWLLALALLWYPQRRGRSAVLGLLTLGFAFAMGWVQQMRGAHFLSHTLWSLWLAWAVILLVHAAAGGWREGTPGARPSVA